MTKWTTSQPTKMIVYKQKQLHRVTLQGPNESARYVVASPSCKLTLNRSSASQWSCHNYTYILKINRRLTVNTSVVLCISLTL